MKTNESAGRPPKEYTADLASVRGVIIEAAALPIEVKPVPGGTLRVLFTETDESDIISAETQDGVWTLQHRKKREKRRARPSASIRRFFAVLHPSSTPPR